MVIYACKWNPRARISEEQKLGSSNSGTVKDVAWFGPRNEGLFLSFFSAGTTL